MNQQQQGRKRKNEEMEPGEKKGRRVAAKNISQQNRSSSHRDGNRRSRSRDSRHSDRKEPNSASRGKNNGNYKGESKRNEDYNRRNSYSSFNSRGGEHRFPNGTGISRVSSSNGGGHFNGGMQHDWAWGVGPAQNNGMGPMDLQYMAGYYNSNGGGRHGFGGHNYGGQFGGYSNARWPWQVPLPPPLDSRRGGGAAVGPNESCTGSRGRHLQPSASSAYVWRRQQTTPPPPRISAEEQKKLEQEKKAKAAELAKELAEQQKVAETAARLKAALSTNLPAASSPSRAATATHLSPANQQLAPSSDVTIAPLVNRDLALTAADLADIGSGRLELGGDTATDDSESEERPGDLGKRLEKLVPPPQLLHGEGQKEKRIANTPVASDEASSHQRKRPAEKSTKKRTNSLSYNNNNNNEKMNEAEKQTKESGVIEAVVEAEVVDTGQVLQQPKEHVHFTA